MNYVSDYCKLKANYVSSVAVLKQIEGELAITNTEELKHRAATQAAMVRSNQKQLKMLEWRIAQLSNEMGDNEMRIFRYYYIKGMTLKKIAKKMYMSESRVYHINGAIKAKINE